VSFLHAVLLYSLQQFIELLFSFEYIDFLRLYLFGFRLLKVLNRGGFPEVSQSLSLKSPFSLNYDHLFLELLL
jgi:hypothetical protein